MAQQVGTTSASQPVTLTNTGIGPLTVGTIGLGGANFGQTNTCATPVAVGSTCTINVTFSPNGAGSRTATMNVNLPGAATTPVTVTLTGTGQAASATLAGTAAFGNQLLGTTSAANAFTYTNTGIGPITVSNTGVTLTGASASDYAIASDTCITGGVGATLAPSGTCQIGVIFTPSATGNRAATLTVIDAAGGAPNRTANLTGTGQSSGAVTPASLTFAGQLVGTSSTSQPVTLKNTGNGPLPVGAIGINGTNPGNFAQTNNCVSPLAVGASCTINVTFTPNALGLRGPASLNVNLPGAATAPVPVSLTGTGTRAVVTFGGGSTALTSTPATGTAKSVVTTITNSGTAPLVIGSISIAVDALQTNPGAYSVANLGTSACPIGGAGLAAGTACQVTVTYTPPAGTLNTIAGTLTVTDTGAAQPTQTRGYTGN